MEHKHTPGPFRISGECTCAIVADESHEGTYSGDSDVKWYGGHMVAESIKDANMPLFLAAPDMFEMLEKLVTDLRELIADSSGVAGLHKNGDIADWDSLTAGQFAVWLGSLETAETLLAKIREG